MRYAIRFGSVSEAFQAEGQKITDMHHAPAQQASPPSRRDGDVPIKDEKQLMECGVGQQS